MRTLSAALLTEQSAVKVTPYVKFMLTSADLGTTYDYTSRVLNLEHHEVAYNDYATVVLRNDDRGVADDLRGYWVQIAYGYITGNNVADVEGAESAGNGATAEYSYTPRLWVKSQQELSSPGNLKTILELEGMWSILKERQWVNTALDPPDFFYKAYSTDTAYAIISALLVQAGFTLDAIGDQSDGIIDVLTPTISINGSDGIDSFDYYDYIIYRILSMTKCYLRAKTALSFKVIFPQTTDAVKETYYSNSQPQFTEYLERKKALVPNHIYVLWGYDAATNTWTFSAATVGEAADTTEIAAYRDVPESIKAAELTSEADADNRAAAILTRRKAELLGGHLITRHDCSVELYDRIEVIDSRGI
jgi:hypothetical protein